MDLCSRLPNSTIGNTNITWEQALSNTLDFEFVSYLRPKAGGALLPWIYTVLVIVVHVPVVIIRVVRWEIVQSWCIISTLFTVILYTQAFISTRFDPAQVLVWTPLILVIDAGSMLQVFFLVIEAKKVRVGNRIVLIDPKPHNSNPRDSHGAPVELEGSAPNIAASQQSSSLLTQYDAWRKHTKPAQQPEVSTIELGSRRTKGNINAASPPSSARSTLNAEAQLQWYRDPAIYSAAAAALLFLAVLILQLMGLVKAAQANNASSAPPPVEWCSPIFQPFGIAAVDGDCGVHDIYNPKHKGVGCITIPGVWQKQWLKGTLVGTIIELITQLFDLLVLSLVSGTRKWRGIKMRRPWVTIFSGVIVLLVTLIYGINYASDLPPGVTSRMMVLVNADKPAFYAGKLTSSGLRGTLIGWNDGLFDSWKTTYVGDWSI
jgi:hypothetical protein